MGLTSIEDALLGFVRTVKNDPGASQLFRDAMHELEVLLDPQAAHQGEPDGDEPAPAPPAPVEQPSGEQPSGEQAPVEQPSGEDVPTPAAPPTGEQAPQGG